MYYIIYFNGACQFTDKEDMATWSSLLSAKAALMVIDVENQSALVGIETPGEFSIAWGKIPEYGKFAIKSE